ncbi:hypothetical protein RCO28_09440 [Streptomyces sp. LHD-70]|uniref:hypothetical protein n=1 Tax=Streptomyces sp. LHD-70 TaxID=3072140 RepID=UPI00280FFB5B|nr:hypothetical protein [Streptomyces sp. LHD-70]MDQ8702710.1 hypothetical protein [Streptomyces sp. LHD-70]
MSEALPLLLIALGMLAVLAGCGWLAVHVRRRGAAGGGVSAAMAAYDEAFKVTSYEAHVEVQAQARRKSPLLSPDEEWRPVARPAGPTGAGGRLPRRVRSRRGLLRGLRRRVARRSR